MSDNLPAELLIPLVQWRSRMGLTQPMAGSALGYKKRMIQNFESGSEEIPRAVRLAMLYLLEHPELALDPDEAAARDTDHRRRPRIFGKSPDDPIVDERWFLRRDGRRTSR